MADNDLISRSALIAHIGDLGSDPEDDTTFLTVGQACAIAHKSIVDMVKAAPAVDAVEVEKAMAWLEGYTMTDTEQIYSNGTVFVPLFRVKQAFVDKAYNGLQEG